MIVWGGEDNNADVLNTGGRYNPNTDSWAATDITGAPTARESHRAVSSGTEMIVWGGYDFINYLNTGGRYNPDTDNWTAIEHRQRASYSSQPRRNLERQ